MAVITTKGGKLVQKMRERKILKMEGGKFFYNTLKYMLFNDLCFATLYSARQCAIKFLLKYMNGLCNDSKTSTSRGITHNLITEQKDIMSLLV